MTERHRAAHEPVEVVDDGGSVVGVTTRADMRARNLWHRSSYVAVVRPPGSAGGDGDGGEGGEGARLVVHQRAGWKDVYPSFWDLAFGGVCGVGESAASSARRELSEEAGIDAVDPVEIGRGRYEDDRTRVVATVFVAVTDAPVRPGDGEVVAVDEVPLAELESWCRHRPVCPDSLAIVVPLLAALERPADKTPASEPLDSDTGFHHPGAPAD